MVRLKFRLLGLCAMILSVMAFLTSGAQAESGANWLILNASGQKKNAGELKAIAEGELPEGATGSLLTIVLGIAVEILCTEFTLQGLGVNLEGNGSVTNGGKAQFGNCSVDLEGVPNAKCKPKGGGAPVGTILTNALKGLLVLHAGALGGGVTRIEPKEGETFVTINMGPECPIGELIPVRGKLYIKDGNLTTHQARHAIEQGPLTDMWVLNKTAQHTAAIDGSAEVFLTGVGHVTLKWSGDPA